MRRAGGRAQCNSRVVLACGAGTTSKNHWVGVGVKAGNLEMGLSTLVPCPA